LDKFKQFIVDLVVVISVIAALLKLITAEGFDLVAFVQNFIRIVFP
jgi:hypothetical protein